MPALLVLAGSLALTGHAQAQGISSRDTNEWTGLGAPELAAARPGPMADGVFQDVKHEGPWSRRSELALRPDARKLLALMQEARWLEALAWLKQTQPDLNHRDELGLTPLSMAARAGQLDLVREMLRQGAEPDQVGAAGMTPLGAAAWSGQELVVRDLLRLGADANVPGRTGQTPLHLACAAGQLGTIQLLLKAGADWQLTNRQGRHALAEAAYFGQMGAIQALQRSGAPLAALDANRLNAVHAAAFGEQRATLAWLRGQGVPVPSVMSQVLIDQLEAPEPH
jgi:hypothetical protein